MNIYGHHPSQIEDELTRLRNEKARDKTFEKNQFRSELRRNLREPDTDLERIMCRISVALFTQRMMTIGERIIDEGRQNGRTFRD